MLTVALVLGVVATDLALGKVLEPIVADDLGQAYTGQAINWDFPSNSGLVSFASVHRF
jgi:hypothetical protein